MLRVRICERVCEINARFLCNFDECFTWNTPVFRLPSGRANFNPVVRSVSCETLRDLRAGRDEDKEVCNLAIGEVFHVKRSGMLSLIMRLHQIITTYVQFDASDSFGTLLCQHFYWTLSHFTDVHQSTTLLYLIVGQVLAGAILWWSGLLGGGFGRLLFVGPGWRRGP